MQFYICKKNGKKNCRQKYLCNNCGHSFSNRKRNNQKTNNRILRRYVDHNQTFSILSEYENMSPRTLRRRLDKIQLDFKSISIPDKTVIIMDTSYFNQDFGVMVFRDDYTKKNLHRKYVKHENLDHYHSGIQYIQKQGWKVVGIVCDGKRGLLSSFGKIPVQLCQFHQTAIITRYITKKPKLQAGIELKEVIHKLTEITENEFVDFLESWHSKWSNFLKEKSYNSEKDKYSYKHKRLRSAYRSLKTNMPYLFTYLKYPDLKIPNTTNSLEGFFSGLKTKLRIHSGLKRERKIKVIDYFLSK